MLVLHQTLWLHKLRVPSGHRAHYLLFVEHLQTIHHVVYRKGSKKFLTREGLVQKIWGIGEQQLNADQLLAQYSMSSLASFCRKRQELDDLGVYELRGFLRAEVSVPGFKSRARSIEILFDYSVSKFPGECKLAEEENSTFWSPIMQVNTEGDAALTMKGEGRYTTLAKALAEDM